MKNSRQRFIFEDLNVRGELVSLDSSWESVLSRRVYPSKIQKLLGELTAAAALLSATIKLDGSLAIQFNGKTELQLLLAEVRDSKTFRSTAKWSKKFESMFNTKNALANGHLAVTITPRKTKQPYQGLVEINGDSIQLALEGYMEQSEQLTTRIWLTSNERKATGMLLQKLPENQSAGDKEDWIRATTLASTITEDELLELSFESILRRLFHEETIRVFNAESLDFKCTCSDERTIRMLSALGKDEISDILAKQKKISVTCEFCGMNYSYSKHGIERAIGLNTAKNAGTNNRTVN